MLRYAVKLVSSLDTDTVEQVMSTNVAQFWKEVFCLLPFFCEFEGSKADGEAVKAHRGLDAIVALVHTLSSKKGVAKGAKEEMDESHLAVLRKFRAFCPPGVSDVMNAILKVRPAAKAKAKAKAKGKSKPAAIEAAAADAAKWFE